VGKGSYMLMLLAATQKHNIKEPMQFPDLTITGNCPGPGIYPGIFVEMFSIKMRAVSLS
jgi:hypothetical protein